MADTQYELKGTENTKVFVGVRTVTSCIVLWRFILGYDLG